MSYQSNLYQNITYLIAMVNGWQVIRDLKILSKGWEIFAVNCGCKFIVWSEKH